jgi:hypothetical protein
MLAFPPGLVVNLRNLTAPFRIPGLRSSRRAAFYIGVEKRCRLLKVRPGPVLARTMTHSCEGSTFLFLGSPVKYECIRSARLNNVSCETGRKSVSHPSLCKANGAI